MSTQYDSTTQGRSILLPPYLRSEMWTDLTTAIDNLFLDTDTATAQLRNLRNPYAVGPLIRNAIATGQVFDTSSAEYQQDLQILLKQLTFNGLPLNNPTYLNAVQALMLFRNIGAYWYMKGTGKIIDFFNFTLGASLSMINLWTTDYVEFEPELVDDGDGGLTPNTVLANNTVFTGGPYYPTTHVTMSLDPGPAFQGVPIDVFLQFFNDTFSYNLVLYSITNGQKFPIGNPNQQHMISIGLYVESDVNPYDI